MLRHGDSGVSQLVFRLQDVTNAFCLVRACFGAKIPDLEVSLWHPRSFPGIIETLAEDGGVFLPAHFKPIHDRLRISRLRGCPPSAWL